MAKVSPFHSKKNPGMYHVCSRCTEGNNIEKGNRKAGTGGGKLCTRCRELQASGGCWLENPVRRHFICCDHTYQAEEQTLLSPVDSLGRPFAVPRPARSGCSRSGGPTALRSEQITGHAI